LVSERKHYLLEILLLIDMKKNTAGQLPKSRKTLEKDKITIKLFRKKQ
jgi:hypothetical protein